MIYLSGTNGFAEQAIVDQHMCALHVDHREGQHKNFLYRTDGLTQKFQSVSNTTVDLPHNVLILAKGLIVNGMSPHQRFSSTLYHQKCPLVSFCFLSSPIFCPLSILCSSFHLSIFLSW